MGALGRDGDRRRVVYSIVDGAARNPYNASMQVFADGEGARSSGPATSCPTTRRRRKSQDLKALTQTWPRRGRRVPGPNTAPRPSDVGGLGHKRSEHRRLLWALALGCAICSAEAWLIRAMGARRQSVGRVAWHSPLNMWRAPPVSAEACPFRILGHGRRDSVRYRSSPRAKGAPVCPSRTCAEDRACSTCLRSRRPRLPKDRLECAWAPGNRRYPAEHSPGNARSQPPLSTLRHREGQPEPSR